MDISLFCDTYIIAEYLRIKSVLERMPRYKTGIHDGKTVIRAYSGSKGERQKRISHEGSKNYSVMLKKIEFYEDCKLKLNVYHDEIKRRKLTIPDDFKFVRDTSEFNVKTWENLGACTNAREVNTGYYDGFGFNVRSRGEMMVGNALKELGLEAKYEPTLILKGERKRDPDYAFPVRIIDRCFFVEFMGMTDDEIYLDNNYGKIDEYMRNGIYINRDLILICGTKNWIPQYEEIKRSIANFINNAVLSAYERQA